MNRLAALLLLAALLTACDTDVSAPPNSEFISFSAVKAERDLRIEYELGMCAGEPDASNPPPGWPYLYGTTEDDKLVAGDDYAVIIYGRAGNDCLFGGIPRNTMFGEAGDDVLFGGAGDDYLHGGPGSDVIFGDEGNDYIVVNDGESDIVYAGKGNDTVYALDGAIDEIDCGPGADTAYVDEFDIVRNCEKINPPSPW
ncbi:MAG TPA: calcium-binding protein [Longimicrobiales bacterium]|nr:calcium-binding protein [Longimicrobiales bacterium]